MHCGKVSERAPDCQLCNRPQAETCCSGHVTRVSFAHVPLVPTTQSACKELKQCAPTTLGMETYACISRPHSLESSSSRRAWGQGNTGKRRACHSSTKQLVDALDAGIIRFCWVLVVPGLELKTDIKVTPQTRHSKQIEIPKTKTGRSKECTS